MKKNVLIPSIIILFLVSLLVYGLLLSVPGQMNLVVGGASSKVSDYSLFDFGSLERQNDDDVLMHVEEIIIILLLIASVVSLITNWIRIPYTVGLVLVGLALAIVGNVPLRENSSELILALLVPPLVFEAAYHIDFGDLRRDFLLILILAVPGVIITTFLVGGIVYWGAGIDFKVALVFGALIAATDPVSVVALFRTMGAPKRLQILLEGESLFNDGTAIVVFNLMVGIALTGHFSIRESILEFILVAGGGVIVGVVLGYIGSIFIRRIDDHLVETTLTTVLAYGSYLVAEDLLAVSGVLAVVSAGLAVGNFGPRGMSATTKIVVANFWEYAAFLANSFVFLLVGLQIDLQLLLDNIPVILWAILGVLVARAVSIYGLSWIGKGISGKWKNILFWGGLRGAIALALALSISHDLPERAKLQAMAFGVVLFTLVVKGVSMEPLIKGLGIVRTKENKLEYERRHARVIAVRAAQTRLDEMHGSGLISDFTWEKVASQVNNKAKELAADVHDILQRDASLHEEETINVWHEALRAQKSTLVTLLRENIISEKIYSELVAELNYELEKIEASWLELANMGEE